MRRWSNLNFYIGPATVNYPPPEGKKPDAVHVVQTDMETAHLYRYVLMTLFRIATTPTNKSIV